MGEIKTDKKIKEKQSYDVQRREPRILLGPLHKVGFTTVDGLGFQVANISTQGIGLLQIEDKPVSRGAENFNGQLRIANTQMPLEVEVVYVTDKIVGCKIANPSEELSQFIGDYFSSELLAHKLKLVDTDEVEDGGKKFLFEGENNCELLIVENPGELVRYKLTLFGNVFDGGEREKLSLGQLISDTDFDNFSHGGQVAIIKTVEEIDPETAVMAEKFIQNIEYLDQRHRQLILDEIRKASKK